MYRIFVLFFRLIFVVFPYMGFAHEFAVVSVVVIAYDYGTCFSPTTGGNHRYGTWMYAVDEGYQTRPELAGLL